MCVCCIKGAKRNLNKRRLGPVGQVAAQGLSLREDKERVSLWRESSLYTLHRPHPQSSGLYHWGSGADGLLHSAITEAAG